MEENKVVTNVADETGVGFEAHLYSEPDPDSFERDDLVYDPDPKVSFVQEEIKEDAATDDEVSEITGNDSTIINDNEDEEDLSPEEIEKRKAEVMLTFSHLAVAKMVIGSTIAYRFDIYYSEKYNSIEYRNIVNAFNEVPIDEESKKDFRTLFACFGIIKWNFVSNLIQLDTDVYESLTKIESLINTQIASCGMGKRAYFEIITEK